MKKTLLTLFTVFVAMISIHAQYKVSTSFESPLYTFSRNNNLPRLKTNLSELNTATMPKQLTNTEVRLMQPTTKSAKSTSAAPVALYRRPAGTYNTGLTTDGNVYYPSFTGNGCTSWKFLNKSISATSYSWTSNGAVFSTDTDGAKEFQIGVYYMPTLTATGTGGTSTYTFGSSETYQMCFSGGYYLPATNAQYYTDSVTSGADFFILGAGQYGSYAYGTGLTIPSLSSTASNAVYSFYEKPIGPLYVDSVYAFIYSASDIPFPDGGKISLTMLKNDDAGNLTNDTIATSTCSKSDLIKLSSKLYVMPFSFKDVDEFGFEIVKGIVINDAFTMKISGFSKTGFDFGFLSDVYNPNAGTASFDINGNIYSWGGEYNLHIDLNTAFTTLYASESNKTLTVHKEGGTARDAEGYVTSLFSTFLPMDEYENQIFDVTTPDWLTVAFDTTYFDSNSIILPVIDASVLPNELTSRTGQVVISCRGASVTINVTQDNATGLFATSDKTVSANKTAEGVQLQYSQAYQKLDIYSLSGQLVKSYSLANSGSFTVRNLQTGSYVFKLTGTSTPVALKLVY